MLYALKSQKLTRIFSKLLIIFKNNWLRLVLKLTTQELSLVSQNLGGDADPSSQCRITFEAEMALVQVHKWVPATPLSLAILKSPMTPSGALWQLQRILK